MDFLFCRAYLASMDKLKDKERRLDDLLSGYGSLLVAFSGGVDSTFLLARALRIPGLRVEAGIVASPVYTKEETDSALAFCDQRNIPHHTVTENDIGHIESNPEDRCYHCKTRLFGEMIDLAKSLGLKVCADGTNAEDLSDYRPGLKAVGELGIRSPLAEAGLTKNDIRLLSRRMRLPTWNKPSMACLSSRFPFGTAITPDRLKTVAESERLLWSLGFSQVRVRWFDDTAVVEVPLKEAGRVFKPRLREKIVEGLKRAGFRKVRIDLEGYRTGSLNPVAKKV
jgi:uncharacterized protein